MITNRYVPLMAPSNSSIDLILCNLEKMCCAFLYFFSSANCCYFFDLLLFLVVKSFCVFVDVCVSFSWEFAIPWTFEHDDQTHHKQLKRATLGILKIMIIIMTVYLYEAKATPLFIR